MKRFLPFFASFVVVAVLVASAFAASRPIAYVPTTSGVLITDGTSTVTAVAPSTTGKVLRSNGAEWKSAFSSGIGYGPYSSRPSSGIVGQIYAADDGPVQFVDTGTEWKPFIPHAVFGKEPPSAAGFTSVNASGLTNATTFAFSVGRLGITCTGQGSAGASEPIRIAYKTAPASGATGYRVTAHFTTAYPVSAGNGSAFNIHQGLGFRQSSNGSIEVMQWGPDSGFWGTMKSSRRRYTASNTGTTPTFTASATVADGYAGSQIQNWIRIERTTTGNRKVYVSPDNLVWHLMDNYSSSANEFITPDQVFIACSIYSDNAANTGAIRGCFVDSYEETAY